LSIIDDVLNHSKKLEIDECEIVFVKKNVTTVRITDSKIVEVKQNFDENYGVRIVKDKKIISVQTTDKKNITKSINNNFENIKNIKSKEFWQGLPDKAINKKLKGTFDEKLYNISGSTSIDIAQNMINSAVDNKITTITGSLNIVSENFKLRNSNGLDFEDKSTYIAGIINAESEYGNTPVSGIGHTSSRTLSNFLAQQIGNDAKKMCIKSINPQKIDSGNYSIIFEPYSVGELLAFVMSHNFNFRTFSEKKSCFSDKINENISVKEFSLTDDPHIPEGIGTKSIDDEGVETQRNDIIKKGVFKNTFSNLYDSYKERGKTTGNASRIGSPMGRSAEPIPITAPHNLKIHNGDTSQDEMIKNTKHGILVGRLWYTYAVNPIKGDFSCTARSGIQIIENGKINGPGKSVRIIHSLPIMLKNISEIGNDQRNVIQWASLPSITPSIKVENVKVNSI